MTVSLQIWKPTERNISSIAATQVLLNRFGKKRSSRSLLAESTPRSLNSTDGLIAVLLN